MERDPVLVPIAAGLKFTLIVQLVAAARLVPHVFEGMAKLPAMLMLPIVSAVVPLLLRVTLLAVLVVFKTCVGKVMLAGERLTIVPTPLRFMVCGLLLALLTIESFPARVPAPLGVNVRYMSQPVAGFTPEVQ
jgi:hypothetical protein